MKQAAISAVAEAYIGAKRLAHHSAVYLYFVVEQIRLLLHHIGDGDKPIASIQAGDIHPLITSASPALALKRYYLYHHFFRFAAESLQLPLINPMDVIKRPVPLRSPLPPLITAEQLSQIVDSLPQPKQKLVVMLAAHLGLRSAEIRSLKTSDLLYAVTTRSMRIPSLRCDRMIPVPLTVLALLAAVAQEGEGTLCCGADLVRLQRLLHKFGNKRLLRALRCSWINYHCALHRSRFETAMLGGLSVELLAKHHYVPAALKDAAKDYFAVTPKGYEPLGEASAAVAA